MKSIARRKGPPANKAHEPAITEKLLRLSNAVVLPHVGSATFHARSEMARLACSAVTTVLSEGAVPADIIV